MPFVDDDAQRKYDNSVAEEASLEDKMFEQMMAQSELEGLQEVQGEAAPATPAQPAQPTAESEGAEPLPIQDLGDHPSNPDQSPGDEFASPQGNEGVLSPKRMAGAPEPTVPKVDTEEQSDYTFGSMMRAGRAGIIKKSAIALDKGLFLLADGLEAMGFEGVDDFETNAQGQRLGIFRTAVGSAGTPEADTTQEAIAEEAGPILAILTPVMLAGTAALTGVGVGIKTASAISGVAGGSIWGAVTTAETQDNIVGIANDAGVSLGPLNSLRTDSDDTTIERMAKNAVVDGALGVLGEAAFAIGALGIRSAAAGIKTQLTKRSIQAVVKGSGRVADEPLEAAVDAYTGAKAKHDLLEQHVAVMADARKTLDQLDIDIAEAKAFGTKEQVATLTREQDVLLREGTSKLDAALKGAAEEFEAAEARLVAKTLGSPGEKMWLENMRKLAGEGGTSGPVNQAFGKAVEAAPAFKKVAEKSLTAQVKLSADDMKLITEAATAGDVERVTEIFGTLWDPRNYGRMIDEHAEGESIRSLIAATSKVLQRDGQGAAGIGVIPNAVTEKDAIALAKAALSESGGDPRGALELLQSINPDINLAVKTLQAMRVLEVSIGYNHLKLVQDAGTEAWGNAQRLQLAQNMQLGAEIASEVMGTSSGSGRLTQSLNIRPLPIDFDNSTTALKGIELYSKEVAEAIEAAGGADHLDAIAGALKAGNDPHKAAAVVRAASMDSTLGDYFYNSYLSGVLSGPYTQARNMFTNFVMLGGMVGPLRVIDNVALTIRHRNTAAWKNWTDMLHGAIRGAKGAFVAGKGGYASPDESTIMTALRTGKRQTAGDGVKFADELGKNSMGLRPEATGNLLRRGLPVNIPGAKGLQATKLAQRAGIAPHRTTFPLLGPEGTVIRNGANKLATVIEARKGVVGKTYDWVSRVQSGSTSLLAAGDELTTAASYGAGVQVAARNAVEASETLTKYADIDEAYEALLRDAPNWKTFQRAASPDDPAALKYAATLKSLDQEASALGRQNTFTDMPPAAVQKFLELRDAIPAMRWAQLFVRTPFNIAKFAAINLTPPGQAAKLIGSAAKEGVGSDAFAKQAGRSAALFAYYGLGYEAISSGRLQGGGPRNFQQNELWREAKGADGLQNKAYSLRIGDKRYSLSMVDPLFTPLTVMADLMIIHDQGSNDDYLSMSGQYLDVMLESMGRVSGMESMGLLFDILQDPENSLRRGIIDIAGGMIVPVSSAQRQLAREFDSRNDKTIIPDQEPGFAGMAGELGARIQDNAAPGLHEGMKAVREALDEALDLPQYKEAPNVNYWGDVRQHNPGVVQEYETPYSDRPGQVSFDKVTDEMIRLNIGVSVNGEFGNINGVKLSPQEQYYYQMQFANPDGVKPGDERDSHKTRPIKEYLTNIIFDPETGEMRDSWKNLGDNSGGAENGGKVGKLNKKIAKRKGRARKALYRKFPVLEEAVERHQENNAGGKRPRDADKIKRRLELGEDTSTSATYQASKVEDLLNSLE